MPSTDFLNTLNTTISGFIYVDVHKLYPGNACRANGFFALATAQAVDFTVLTTVLVTLVAVIRPIHLPKLSGWRIKLLICSSTWAVPLVTSLTALTMGALIPVDSNWCDITAMRPRLRYSLERGWRLAIMLLAMCLYAFVWVCIHKHHMLFSATDRVKVSSGLHTRDETNDLALLTSAPARASLAHSSLQAASCPIRHVKGAGHSKSSLPRQGYGLPGADFLEKGKTIDSRTERISQWARVRHPGMINSISAFKSQSQLLTPQTISDPPFSRTFTVNADAKSPEQSLSTLPPSSTRPNYHSQCPKVRKFFAISSEERTEVASSPVLVQGKQGPPYHESAKSFNSVGAQTQSSFETVPWRIRSAGQPASHKVKWPFFDHSSSFVQFSDRTSTSTSLGEYSDSGLCSSHSHQSKITKPLENRVNNKHKFRSSPPAVHLEGSQHTRQRYYGQDPWPQDILSSPYRHEERWGHSKTAYQSALPGEYSFESPIKQVRNVALSKSKYHSQCPKVNHTFELSVNASLETTAGPNYHSQCPKVTKTVSISPTGSSMPRTPPLILRPDVCSTKTTIVTAPREPPPSPTPGLPPPPWSAEAKQQRRKTFLLSRSTWSESTISQHSPSSSDATKTEREIRRTLLLNAYPLAYFILSLPWMVNSYMEVQGSPLQDRRAMNALLGLPQYLGLVNSIIFAVNECLKTMRRKAMTLEMGQRNYEKGLRDSEGV